MQLNNIKHIRDTSYKIVEYMGNKFSIPNDHDLMAIDVCGFVRSFPASVRSPAFSISEGEWYQGINTSELIACIDPIDITEAVSSLRHVKAL